MLSLHLSFLFQHEPDKGRRQIRHPNGQDEVKNVTQRDAHRTPLQPGGQCRSAEGERRLEKAGEVQDAERPSADEKPAEYKMDPESWTPEPAEGREAVARQLTDLGGAGVVSAKSGASGAYALSPPPPGPRGRSRASC